MSRVHLTQDFEEQELSAFKSDHPFDETFRFHMLNLDFNCELFVDDNSRSEK